LRRDGRAAGLTRRDAVTYAGREINRVWPDDGSPGVAPLPPDPPPTPVPETPAEAAPGDQEGGVAGLGDLPSSWPDLPANASLAAEIQWVQASRLDVVEELPSGGIRVHLVRADRPPPSKGALSWLETSILFPAKFTDVTVRATQHQEDEREHVRRERVAVEETRGLLADMMGEGAT